MQCGFDLAPLRAVHDPHYDLPLVTCPRCQWTCARRTHAMHRQHHRRRKAVRAGGCLAIQLLILWLLSLSWVSLIDAVHVDWSYGVTRYRRWFEFIFLMTWAFGIIPVLAGLWLSGCLRHHARRTTIGMWALWIPVLIPLLTVREIVSYWDLYEASLMNMQQYAVHQWQDLKQNFWPYLGIHGLMMAALLALGVPAGAVARRLIEKNIQLRRLILLRKRRAWRLRA